MVEDMIDQRSPIVIDAFPLVLAMVGWPSSPSRPHIAVTETLLHFDNLPIVVRHPVSK